MGELKFKRVKRTLKKEILLFSVFSFKKLLRFYLSFVIWVSILCG